MRFRPTFCFARVLFLTNGVKKNCDWCDMTLKSVSSEEPVVLGQKRRSVRMKVKQEEAYREDSSWQREETGPSVWLLHLMLTYLLHAVLLRFDSTCGASYSADGAGSHYPSSPVGPCEESLVFEMRSVRSSDIKQMMILQSGHALWKMHIQGQQH